MNETILTADGVEFHLGMTVYLRVDNIPIEIRKINTTNFYLELWDELRGFNKPVWSISRTGRLYYPVRRLYANPQKILDSLKQRHSAEMEEIAERQRLEYEELQSALEAIE